MLNIDRKIPPRRRRAIVPSARRRFGRSRSGGVTVEYVVLAVLIAAAVVVAVAVFSRSIAGMFFTAGDGATLRHSKAKQELDMRRGDRDHDTAVAKSYHDSMHE